MPSPTSGADTYEAHGGPADAIVALVLCLLGASLAAAIIGGFWPAGWLPPGSESPRSAYDLRILKLMMLLEGGGIAALGLLVAWRGAWLRRVAAHRPLETRAGTTLVLLGFAHLAGVLFYLPPQQILSPEPVNTGAHLAHFYRIFTGHRILSDGWHTSGYDPYFLCGTPAGIALDPETRGDTLFAHALAFAGLGYATKVYILLVNGLLPLAIYAAGRILGLGRTASLLAAGLGILHWHWGRPYLGALRWAGMHSFLLACQLTLVGIACIVRFHDPDHRVRVLCCVGMLGVLLALGLVQPAGLLLLAPAMVVALALGQRRLRGRDRAAILLVLVLALAVHTTWLLPAARYGQVFGAPGVALQIASLGALVRLFLQPTSGLALAILILGAAGLLVWSRHDRLGAWSVGVTAIVWLLAPVVGPHVGALARVECARALVPLLLLLVLPTGMLAERAWRRVPPGTPSLLVVLGLVIAGTLPAFASVLDSRFYYVHRLHATLDTRFAELAAAIDATAPSDARLLFEPTVNARTPISNGIPLEALVPIHTRREVVGAPQPGTPFAVPMLEFGGGSLGGRRLEEWTGEELADYLERYDIGAVVAWAPLTRAFLTARQPLLESAGEIHGFEIFRCNRTWSRVSGGQARVRADYDRIEIFDVQGEELLVKFHWTPDLRAFPPLPLTRAPQPGDATGFFRLRPAGHTRLLVGRAP